MPSVHVQLLEKFQALFWLCISVQDPNPLTGIFFFANTENILYNICCVWGGSMETLRKLHAHLAIFITCAPVDLE